MQRPDYPPTTPGPLPPAAKITPPGVPDIQIRRSRLLGRLTAAPADQVTVLCAPAGYGKTQLLAAWAASRTSPTAWVTLDPGDNDQRRFWSAVASALRGSTTMPTSVDLSRLDNPEMPSMDAAYVAAVAEAVTPDGEPITLILDDVQVVDAPGTVQALTDLITYCRPQLRLVLASRTEPPIRLGRLRLEERLLELRGPELAFTVEEAGRLTDRAGLTLSTEQVSRLIEQTAGWAAGLRLASLAMRRTDPAVVLADLVGTTGAISDYLVDEVLSGLDEDARRLMDCIAVCGQVTAPLAQEVSGVDDAGALLADLESATSLVTSFGDERRWFQLHPLLRAHLLVEIHRFRPEAEPALHGRAASWFAQRGSHDRAIQHAVRSRDQQLVSELVSRYGERLLVFGHHAALRAADAALPDLFSGDTRLALIAAVAHLEVGDTDAGHRFADHAAATWPSEPPTDLVWLALLVDKRLLLLGEKPSTLSIDTDAPIAEPSDRSLTALALATAAAADGRPNECRWLADDLVAIGRSTGNAYLTARGTTLQTVAASLSGDLATVWEMAARTDVADPILWRGTVDDALMRVVRAQAALYRGEPELCLDIVKNLTLEWDAALAPPSDSSPLTVWARLLTATATFDRGERSAGLDQLAEVRCRMELSATPAELLAVQATVEHDAALQLNRNDQVREVLGWAERALPDSADVRYIRAHGAARISRFRFAQKELEPILAGAIGPVNPPIIIHAWVLASWIRIRLDERERALAAVSEALAAADRLQVLRPLFRAPEEVLTLLSEQIDSWGRYEKTARMVLARRPRTALPAIALTRREQQVLNLLQGQLALDEIADNLTVSPNTVKTHVRSIYGKFGATSRREAIRMARSQGLL